VDVSEVIGSSDRILLRIVQSRIEEGSFAVHLQIRDKRIPVTDRAPSAGPGVQVHPGLAESWRDQGCGGFTVRTKRFAVEVEFGVELARAPAHKDFFHCRDICMQKIRNRLKVGGEGYNCTDIQILVRPAIQTMTNHSFRNSRSREG